tara:strand:- start:1008 stop:1631 length:624 start_codon:yes stop_codon:yes gene_type:complete
MNQKNSLGLNSCFLDLDDPFGLFKSWMNEAEKREINSANAFSLATANNRGEPSSRMILLKEFSSKGFIFYTHLNSPKSSNLKQNPKAAMCFHWKSLLRQVRIFGTVTQVEDSQADAYFSSRPYKSKINAWASDQSNTMNERTEFLNKIKDFEKKYKNEKDFPRPPHWSGWNLRPSSIEFWLSVENRNHERLKYNRTAQGWKKEILYP